MKQETKRKVVGGSLILLALVGAGYATWRGNGGGEVKVEAPAPPPKIAQMQPELAEDGSAAVAPEGATIKGSMYQYRPGNRDGAPSGERPAPNQPPTARGATAQQASPELPSLVHSFSVTPLPPQRKDNSPGMFAPRGTLVSCQLVLTLDSSSLQTPVLGMVTKNVYHEGKLIIPAGTEVHGFAKNGRMRDRIEANGSWTFVWENGQEYRIGGISLDREANPDGEGWGITDGSAGIRGQIMKTDDYQELKMMFATFLSGVARSSQKTTQTIFGPQPDNSITNAGLEGVSDVGQQYASMLLKKIQEEGYFVRVAAGTEFYIYLLGVFEPELASVGGVSQGEGPVQSWEIDQHRYEAQKKEFDTMTAKSPEDREDPAEERIREAMEQRAKLVERFKKDFPVPPPPAQEAPANLQPQQK